MPTAHNPLALRPIPTPPPQEYGEAEARGMVAACPDLLASDPRTRRRSEAALGLLWVAAPRALALRRPQLLCAELAEPACVATRLLLQLYFGLSPAEVYGLLGCAASSEAQQLACRLSYAELCGLRVAATAAGRAAAAAAQGSSLPPAAPGGGGSGGGTALAAAPPAGLCLDDLAGLPEEQLLSHMQLLLLPGSAHFAAFAAAFPQRPEWRHLQQEADAESARLLRLLRGAS